MSLHLSLVFGLLMFEIAVFFLLILPLPFKWRRGIFRWISRSVLVAKLQFGLRIIFIFVFVLFADSVNRIWKVEHDTTHSEDIRTETSLHAKKFYNQRNMYLTGFTLFLFLILNQTYGLILDLLTAEEKLEEFKKEAANQSKDHRRVADGEAQFKKDIEALTKELEEERKKDKDFETLKKQASQQYDEYMRLADKYNQLQQEIDAKDKKSD